MNTEQIKPEPMNSDDIKISAIAILKSDLK